MKYSLRIAVAVVFTTALLQSNFANSACFAPVILVDYNEITDPSFSENPVYEDHEVTISVAGNVKKGHEGNSLVGETLNIKVYLLHPHIAGEKQYMTGGTVVVSGQKTFALTIAAPANGWPTGGTGMGDTNDKAQYTVEIWYQGDPIHDTEKWGLFRINDSTQPITDDSIFEEPE